MSALFASTTGSLAIQFNTTLMYNTCMFNDHHITYACRKKKLAPAERGRTESILSSAHSTPILPPERARRRQGYYSTPYSKQGVSPLTLSHLHPKPNGHHSGRDKVHTKKVFTLPLVNTAKGA